MFQVLLPALMLSIVSLRLVIVDADGEEHPGWDTLLSDNTREFENVTIAWDNPANVPTWLYGTYLKNGPARSQFGGEKSFGNVVDGWAKITKFHVTNKAVTVSSNFLKTETYQKCEAAKDLVPQATLGPVLPKGWGVNEFKEILDNPGHNTDVTIDRMGSDFIASTDLPTVNIFDVKTLEWKESFDPKLRSIASSAHWRKEPGTSNMLNYHITGMPGFYEELRLYRYIDGNIRTPTMVGKFHLEQSTMIHQFSVSKNYAIFFVYPISMDLGCAVFTQLMQNMLECARWEGDQKDTIVIVMSLKTGRVVSKSRTNGFYSTHHVNAYETISGGGYNNDDDDVQIVVDTVIPPWYSIKNFTDRTTMLNWIDSGANHNKFDIKRFTIDLKNDNITSSHWTNNSPQAQPYYNQFDFPNINPRYEGRRYCFAYGQAVVENYRQYIIKKNICDSTQDKVWYKRNHYTGEPMFIPRPGGTDEDDGVLLVVVLDGMSKTSYLLLLDGKTFTALATARMDTFIPMSFHGKWYNEIL